MTPPAHLFSWRTQQGQEVDFIFEYGRKILAVEVKQSKNPTYSDANGIRAFLSDHPDAIGGLILHSGTVLRWLGERILAVPWTMITG
jgi:predicted AAA+ superfamily ATPase